MHDLMCVMDSEDEDDQIEAEIQQQLISLTLSENELFQNNEDDIEEDQDEDGKDAGSYYELDEGYKMPDGIQKYLDLVNKRSQDLQRDLEECEHIVSSMVQGTNDDEFYYQSAEMKEMAFVLGEDPEELRDRVLAEVEEEEKKESDHITNHTMEHAPDTIGTPSNPPPHQHKEGSYIVTEATDTLEQKGWQNLLQLDGQLKQRHMDMLEETQHQIKQQAIRDQLTHENRSKKQKQYSKELDQLQEDRKISQAKAEEELELEAKKKEEVLAKYQAEIEEFAKQTEKERVEFEHQLAREKQQRQRQRLHAATLIQAAVRSYRIRKKYRSRLNRLREERHQRQLQNRQMEIISLRRAEEQRKKKEKAEKKEQEEEERRKNEEILRQAEEKRQREERLEKEKLEQERKRTEMLERQRLEERKKQQEEKMRQEKELEERSQEILSKIEEERTGIPQVTCQELDGSKIANNADSILQDTRQESPEVFITTSKEDQSMLEQQQNNNGVSKPVHVTSKNVRTPTGAVETCQPLRLEEISRVSTASIPSKLETGPQQDGNNSSQSLLGSSHQQSLHSDTNTVGQLELDSVTNEVTATVSPQAPMHSSQSGVADPVTYAHAVDEENLSAHLSEMSQEVSLVTTHTDVKLVSKPELVSKGSQVEDKVVVKENVSFLNGHDHQESDSSLNGFINIEEKKRQWIQNCVFHSNLVSSRKCKETRKALRKVHGANLLPTLTSSQLLAASQPGMQLSQVTVIMVEDAGACSLSSLSSCPHLQYLHIQRCGVMLLEGLDHCADITCIDLQHNKVEGIHCRDRAQLAQLLLQGNKLTSIQGLEGCSQLRYVQLANNSITRTGGLESLVSITHLDISNNQLVSINGLGHLVCLQDLNLSHNHLSSVQELQTCCLLERLSVENNCLVEMPPVQNHVLLRELKMNDNSLSSILPLTDAWLPLLQYLYAAQNGLSDVPDMKYCLLLKKFDISHNCISDVNKVVDGLKFCYHLEELQLEGNPLTQEDNYRCDVLGSLVWLQFLDNEAVKEPVSSTSMRGPYVKMCLSQLNAQDQLHTAYQHYTQSILGNFPNSILQAGHARTAYLECSLKQAIEHRHMHESGDMTEMQQPARGSAEATFYECVSTQTKPDECRSAPSEGSAPDGSDSLLKHIQKADDHLQTIDEITHGKLPHQSPPMDVDLHTSPTATSRVTHAESRPQEPDPQQQLREAVTLIQARWRGYVVRRDLDVHAKQWLAALCIQAVWRGYRVRKMVAAARQAVRYQDSEEEDDAMLYDEVDPTSWDLAQVNVDREWLPPETPSIPKVHPPVPPTNTQSSQHQAAWEQQFISPPRQAWYAADSPTAGTRYTARNPHSPIPQVASKPPIPPVQSSPGRDTPRTSKSHKQDRISEEWGFKDATTAELMMKRAKKLTKAGSTRKKKMLDPLQRYQQMKKVHDSGKIAPPPKRGLQRQEFFQAREKEIQSAIAVQQQEKEQKQARTFQWVHSHAGVSGDALLESGRHSTSEPNLPVISPLALQGRVQLTASPLLELQSVDGVSSTSSMSHRPRSHSLSSPQGQVHLPAIKTNSAPSGRTRERQSVRSRMVPGGRTGRNNCQV